MNNNPLISVIMACYNDEKYISEAIESIVDQTYPNWELIIIDDSSTDNSIQTIKNFRDSRIKIICNEENKGLAYSLNRGIKEAKSSEYLARMDSDDIAIPDRFEKQLRYLQEHKDVAIVGANVELFDNMGTLGVTKIKGTTKKLMAQMPFCSPLPHSTWMVNLGVFKEPFRYDDTFRSSQDYELMYRLFSNEYKISCIEDTLLRYRVRNDSISHKSKAADTNTLRVQMRVLERFGIKNSKDYTRSLSFCNSGEDHSLKCYRKAISLCIQLLKNNMYMRLVNQGMLLYYCIKHVYGCTRVIMKKG